MTAGLQSWNSNTGLYQIDGETPMLTFDRAGSVTSGGWFGDNANHASLASVPLAGDELIAVRPTTGSIGFNARSGGSMHFWVPGAVNATVHYWVFKRYSPSGANYGAQLFDGNGTIIYDTGRAPMSILAVTEGLASFNSALTTAVMFCSSYQNLQMTQVYNSILSLMTSFYVLRGGVANFASDSVSIQASRDLLGFQRSERSTGVPGPTGFNRNNGAPTRVLVLDVTGLP